MGTSPIYLYFINIMIMITSKDGFKRQQDRLRELYRARRMSKASEDIENYKRIKMAKMKMKLDHDLLVEDILRK
jgi:hypothetical protein